MKEIVESVRRLLRKDPLVSVLVGVDLDDEVKVYDELAKTNSQAPYIVISMAPGGDSPGTYGEKYTVYYLNEQITCWHTEPKLAWQLHDAVEEALEKGDYDAGPYEFMQVRRLTMPQPLPDRDTNWFQVALSLQFQFSGPGVT